MILASKRRKYGWSRKVIFRKSQKLLTERAPRWRGLFIKFKSYSFNFSAGYVNAVRAIVCSELPAREASNFCDFWKLTSCDFIPFISSLTDLNFDFCTSCLLRINLPNMSPNMNHFDAMDFTWNVTLTKW